MSEDATLQDQEARDAAKKLETYEWGFHSDIEQEFAPKGLDESTVRFISAKKNEPEWMLEWRLKAFRMWQEMATPDWAKLKIPPIDYQDAYYYAAPKVKPQLGSLDEVDPEILRVYEKLGIPIEEQKVLAGVEGARKVAVDAVFDSVSVATTFREELKRAGVVFLSISEAIREYPEQVKKWLGKVVPPRDNYFACLNAAVFSDGTFVWIPEGVRCPMELSTYFRINAENTGQFERTLIIAEKGAYVSYLEGCTAPQRDENQLHAAVVELIALDDAEIKYSTVQNWYPGDAEGKGGIYNFVTKRALCQGKRSKVSWTQVETGSAITWKYPSCVLNGEDSVGEFYSVAVTNNHQQADTGTKMIHNAPGTRSTIISKGISAGKSSNTYRGLVRMGANAEGARNFTQCDSLLLGDQCGAHTVPYIEVKNPSAQLEHEATTSKISDDQLFYAMQRGLGQEEAVALIVNGFAREVLQQLPMEFAVEAQKLLGISLEGERRVMTERRKLSLGAVAERAEGAAAGDRTKAWTISPARAATLKDRARAMRRDPTPAQALLWSRLQDKAVGGFAFNREVVMGSAIVDFACKPRWLVVEIGGVEGAEAALAELTDRKLREVGVRVLRFSDEQVLEDIETVIGAIGVELEKPFERPRIVRNTNA